MQRVQQSRILVPRKDNDCHNYDDDGSDYLDDVAKYLHDKDCNPTMGDGTAFDNRTS